MAATGAAHAIPRLLRAVGSIAAPTSVITALLFYFGRLHASAFLFYFGVNFTALDLTVQDYLVRSADGLFRPAAATAALVLLAFWAHRVTTQVLGEPARRRVRRVVVPVAGSAGAVLLGIAFLGMIRGDRIYRPVPEIGGLTLAGGVLLLSYAARSVRRPDAGPVRRRPPDGAPVGTGVTLAEWGGDVRARQHRPVLDGGHLRHRGGDRPRQGDGGETAGVAHRDRLRGAEPEPAATRGPGDPVLGS